MAETEDPLRDLVEALQLTPDNVPLRQHVAEQFLKRARYDEAEALFEEGLRHAPESERFKLGLAKCSIAKGKGSKALVILEDLASRPDAAHEALILCAKQLLKAGERMRARAVYHRALAADPTKSDPELHGELGAPPAAPRPGGDAEGKNESWSGDGDEDEPSAVRSVVFGDAGSVPFAEIERPKVRFSDVGGMENVKDEIRMKVIHPLTHPELYKAYGKKIGGGILLYGPPGCGKTHIARATAGEVNANFIAVGIHDILDMWIGSSEKQLHALFENARANTPCVLFFDEVDALAAARADMKHSGSRHVINQFLQELDGVETSNEGLLILAATNAPWHLDSAFRRPGRFDRVIFVPPPDVGARAEILRLHLLDKPVEDLEFEDIAKRTEGFSGADLRAVVDVAVEAKLKDAMKRGRPEPIRTKDLAAAAKSLHPTTKEWFASAKNYAVFANQGGIYDDILKYMKLA